MARPFLSVIIPAWDEAERLPLTLIDIDRYLSVGEYSYEIIVVNDGSSDRTSEIVKRFIGSIKNCKIIDSPEHRGKGAAVKIGIVAAKGNWRLVIDADNSFAITEFNRILPHIAPDRGVDVVVGSRVFPETIIDPPLALSRRIAERMVNAFTKRLFHSEIRDFLLGFQCYSADAAEAIFGLTRAVSWSYAAESLILAERSGYRVLEVAVVGGHAPGSHFTFPVYLRWLAETGRIWWWLRRGKYQIKLIHP